MKKLLFLLIAAGGAASAIAQGPNTSYTTDALLSRWVVDVNLVGGFANQDFKTANTINNYPNALNSNTGNLKFKNGYAYGADAQLGFFFGEKRHFGIGTGFMYMTEHGFANLDNFHIEYQATDFKGSTFRQLITGNNISETITSSSMNIPVMLKYKNRFSEHWGFAADAGALINLEMKNAYKTNASFDYEAIYKFGQSGDGGTVAVYDNSPTPSVNDWLITKTEFLRNNPNGNFQDYLNAKRALGYNVGEGLKPGTSKGNTSYTQGSVGFMVQPSLNYFLSDMVALNFGVYYLYQPFKNAAASNYHLTDGAGNYSSVLNNVTESHNQSYGLNIGVRFFLGKKHIPLTISSVNQSSPSQCGICDGSIALNGLFPNQPVTVDYSLNGAQPTRYSSTVQPDGQVKIPNLCAGSYTGIKATIKKENAMGKAVILGDPSLNISSQIATHPTLSGGCNGSIMFKGLYAGRSATINYNLNGASQAPFTGIVNPDNSITISGLCEGTYTGIMLTCNTCTTKGTDFTLVAPAPPPLPPAPPMEKIDISAPVLFEFDKSDIQSSYYPILDEASKEVVEGGNTSIRVDGHTDAIGTYGYNQKLSERRAMSVKRYLINKGVRPDRVKIYGHGKTQPAATNKTSEGRRQNRRAVMNITGK